MLYQSYKNKEALKKWIKTQNQEQKIGQLHLNTSAQYFAYILRKDQVHSKLAQ